jgi:hypothetical protein
MNHRVDQIYGRNTGLVRFRGDEPQNRSDPYVPKHSRSDTEGPELTVEQIKMDLISDEPQQIPSICTETQ